MQHLQEILAVGVFAHGSGQVLHLLCIYPLLAVGDLFRAGDFQSLPVLDGLDSLAGLDQAFVRTGIQPRISPSHTLDRQRTALEVTPIEIGDF